MAWIKVHSELWDSWKLPNLCQALEISEVQAVGHLISLWSFTERNAWRDGDLTKWGVLGIAKAAKWQGDPSAFVKSLQQAEFLGLESLIIHEWVDHQAGMIHNRERNSPAKSPRTTGKIPANQGENPEPDKSRVDKSRDKNMPDKSGEFAQFWKAYPRKTGKKQAIKAWNKLKPNLERCLSTLKWQITSQNWTKEDGQFIPYPATWLNAGQWDDVPTNCVIVNCSKCGAEGVLHKSITGTPICKKCKELEIIKDDVL